MCAAVGDATGDHRGDMMVCDSTSHSVSAWEQTNTAPVAHAGGPYTAGQGDPLVFDGSSETGSSEAPYMEYMWDFGDGDVTDWEREPNPTHAYLTLGSFDVTMWVRDPAGLEDSDSTQVDVIDSSPHPDFSWAPLNPCEGQLVTFTDATVSTDAVVRYTWWVDGAQVSDGLVTEISSEFDDGMHSVTLEAEDSDGSVANTTHEFAVLPLLPELVLSCPEEVDEGDAVTLSVEVDAWHGGPVDSIETYEWDLAYTGGVFTPDEVTDTNATVQVFGASGDYEVYTVAVRVTDVDGDANTSMLNMVVNDIGPTASFDLSPSVPTEGTAFSFIDSTYTYDGIVSWHWTMVADGVTSEYDLNASDMAALEFPMGDGPCSMTLNVTEGDGDSSEVHTEFEVAEVAPQVVLSTTPAAEWYSEFQEVGFSAVIESYDSVVSIEWDFDALGGEFVADQAGADEESSHTYLWTGDYTAKVRVTDSDGSAAVQPVYIEIRDTALTGSFLDDITASREDPELTSLITFDASALYERYPDISNIVWEFGDGEGAVGLGGPLSVIEHLFDPVRDYTVNVSLSDDDGNLLVLSRTLKLVEPVVLLVTPEDGSVLRSGTPVRFIIGDDTTPLVAVQFSLDGSEFSDFETLYELDTSSWVEGDHAVTVRAEDRDGNIAYLWDLGFTIDDSAPLISLVNALISAHGGDKMNLSVLISDPNVDPASVHCNVTFPGASSETSFQMVPGWDGVFYIIIEVPLRSGEMTYYVWASDLAGNSDVSETETVSISLRFIDVALPYLLAAAVAAAVIIAIYFLKEGKIAVDEVFVIYNDGRMLAHSTRRLKPGMDDQVLSGMFVAVQDFVKDSFKDETSFTLRKMDFGERSVLIEKGQHIYLAVVLHAKASKKVAVRMKVVVDEIEDVFSEHLMDWDGDLDKVRGVNTMVKRLYSKAPMMPFEHMFGER